MRRVVIAASVACLAVSSASALTLIATRESGYFAGNGGEFSIFGTGFEANYAANVIVTTTRGTGFQTFCLEVNESLIVPRMYEYTMETYAIEGGVGGADPVLGGDPLGRGTAWLYRQFATGTLALYDYSPGPGREASAGMLQQAFWYLEDEITLADWTANPFLSLAASQWGGDINEAKETATLAELGGVRVLNPFLQGTHYQSVLVYTRVPDGGLTIGLLGLSLAGLSRMRRRLMA